MQESSKIEEIYQGFKNLVFKNEEVEKLAEDRLKICNTCVFVKRELTPRCGKCGCILASKCRSPKSNCPIKLW